LKKKKQKTFAHWEKNLVDARNRLAGRNKKKFFASFFQKRRPSFLLKPQLRGARRKCRQRRPARAVGGPA
jgi:hypothetical protein